MTRQPACITVCVAAVLLMAAARTNAQGLAGRVALEAIASASMQTRAMDDPMVMLDLVGSVRIADGLDLFSGNEGSET